jgi:hypothetical protein
MKKLTFWGLLLFCSTFMYAQEAIVLDEAILDAVDFSLQSYRRDRL